VPTQFRMEGKTEGRVKREGPDDLAWWETLGMCVRFLCGTREISRSSNSQVPSAALVRVGKVSSR